MKFETTRQEGEAAIDAAKRVAAEHSLKLTGNMRIRNEFGTLREIAALTTDGKPVTVSVKEANYPY